MFIVQWFNSTLKIGLFMKVAFVLGTRPEIIKMAPIIFELKKNKIQYEIIHSGQHYSYNLDKVFFDQLNIPKPKFKLEVGSGTSSYQTAKIIEKTEKILRKIKPDIVLVQGDTNTVLGGALAAKQLGIKIGHVEAGLRSFDEEMPEEMNRILADHCSNLLFAPTKVSQKNLLAENIEKKKIFVTGNTIVDSVFRNLNNNIDILKKFEITRKKYFLISIHRQENVDNPKKFKNIIQGLKKIRKKYQIPLIYPIHPRSEKMMKKFKISIKGITTIQPIDYFSFLTLEKNARLVLTDSGGVQEECCILKTPCVTLRNNTERPETVSIKANIIAGTIPNNIFKCTEIMLKRNIQYKNPYGDGSSAKKIVNIIQKKI